MVPPNAAALARHHRHNRLLSLMVMAGICGWMALIGWLVAGLEGIVWAAAGTGLMLLVQPVRSTTLLKAVYGAVPLTPATAPDMYGVMRALAERAGLPRVPALLYIPRPELIALSTGWGRDGAIALSEGMVRILPGRELAAVLAHETSHLRTGDLKLLRVAEAAGRLTRLLSLAGLILMAMYLPAIGAMGGEAPLLAVLLLVMAPLVSDLLTLKLSRTREFDADAGAVELTGDPAALMAALERIEALQHDGDWERLTRGGGLRWLRLIRTHPTIGERLARLRELAPPPSARWLNLQPDTVLVPTSFGLVPLTRWHWIGGRAGRRR